MKVVFLGTPTFAAEVLTYLLANKVNVVAVISRPDKPKGRSSQLVPTPVKVAAISAGIPVYQPEKVSAPEFADTLKAFDADLFVVVAYGEILRQHILDMPKLGCINLHTSLLPKYRGAAPIQRAIINGETETGVTIMHVVRKMDAGDIIKSEVVPIGPDDDFGKIEGELCNVGQRLLLDVIHDFERGCVKEVSQDEAQVTIAPKIEREDCEIDWHKSAQEIHNLVRGVNPYPSAWCMVEVKGEKKILKVISSKIAEGEGGEWQRKPGEIIKCDATGMLVVCGEGALYLKDVQLEGKKVMSAADLVRGVSLMFCV